MITLETPDTFSQQLKIRTLGQIFFVNVTFNNIEPDALDAEVAERGKGFTDAELILKLVKEWEVEVELTTEGLAQLHKKRPGVIRAVIDGYFLARMATIEKNW